MGSPKEKRVGEEGAGSGDSKRVGSVRETICRGREQREKGQESEGKGTGVGRMKGGEVRQKGTGGGGGGGPEETGRKAGQKGTGGGREQDWKRDKKGTGGGREQDWKRDKKGMGGGREGATSRKFWSPPPATIRQSLKASSLDPFKFGRFTVIAVSGLFPNSL